MLFLNIEDLSIFITKSVARVTMYDTFFFQFGPPISIPPLSNK